MQTILKHELEITDSQSIMLHKHADILDVGNQGGKLVLWAEEDTSQDKMPIAFKVIGTGQPVPNDDFSYVGTAQVNGFVWHVYTD